MTTQMCSAAADMVRLPRGPVMNDAAITVTREARRRKRPTPSTNHRKNAPRDFAQADAVAVALTPTRQRQTVAVLQKTALLATGQRQRLAAAPRQLQQAAVRLRCRPANRPRRQHVAGPQVAAVDGVMRQLLRHAP